MELDLSAGALVRAGGGLVLALAGVAIAALGRAQRRNVLLGLALVPFGLVFILTNLATRDSPTPALTGAAAGLFAASVAALAAAATVDERVRPFLRSLGLAAAAVVAVALAPLLDPSARVDFYLYSTGSPLGVGHLAAYFAAMALFVAYAAALALGVRAGRGESGRGTALLAVGLGLFPAFDLGTNLPHVGIALADQGGPAWTVSSWLVAGAVVAAASVWIAVRAPGRPYLVAWALLASCLVGVGTGGWELRTGGTSPMYGLVRIAAAATLAYGVFRGGLLGVPLPRLAARRGSVATASLVGFFVVAQVAQEFLSDSMGVLIGGVAAGALLFAAVPLQRAAERLVVPDDRPLPSNAAAPRAEDIYRAALLVALHDGAMTAAEERHLADVADGLGLSVSQTIRLRDQVTAEIQEAR